MAQKGSEGREVRVIDKMSQWANKWENSEWRPEEEEEAGGEGGCLGVSKCTGEDGGDGLGVGCNDSYSDDALRRKRQGVELCLTTAGAEWASQEQQWRRKQNVLGDSDGRTNTWEQSRNKSEHRGEKEMTACHLRPFSSCSVHLNSALPLPSTFHPPLNFNLAEPPTTSPLFSLSPSS